MAHKKGKQEVVTVDIQSATWSDLTEIAKSRNLSARQMVNDLLIRDIVLYEQLGNDYPSLKKVGLQDNVMFVADEKQPGKVYEVEQKEKRLFCRVDNSFTCSHVQFVYHLPETGQLYLQKPA